MAQLQYKKGDLIYKEGDPVISLGIITEGSATAGKLAFNAGDILAVADISYGAYRFDYIAENDVKIFAYDYEDDQSITNFLKSSDNISRAMLNSLLKKIKFFLGAEESARKRAFAIYNFISSMYRKYEDYSTKFAFPIKKLPFMENFTKPENMIEKWLVDYYSEDFSFTNQNILIGFFHKALVDVEKIYTALDFYEHYSNENMQILFSENSIDVFELITTLHIEAVNIKGADEGLSETINIFIEFLQSSGVSVETRVLNYKSKLEKAKDPTLIREAEVSGINFSESLSVIINYAPITEELKEEFLNAVHSYINLSDRNSSEEGDYKLRRTLADKFNELYLQIFLHSMNSRDIPAFVKMFLNFGFVDTSLSGTDYANFLYSIVDTLGNEGGELYTTVEWLKAIYHGEREPSRNELDQDYPTYLRNLRNTKQISEETEEALLYNQLEKVKFELKQVFPIANKITYGRPSTFCPVFTASDVQKHLNASLVKLSDLKEFINEVRNINYTAYYRESVFFDSEKEIPSIPIHKEILPIFVLVPNIGSRGVLWQEMSGRDKTSPPLIFLPTFFMGDLKNTILRLTGEYIWEITKRITATRWADISLPSVTSEYFNYLQFYRNNREISLELRETIKNDLKKERNNFKGMFVSNYVDWVLYESGGLPKLNKVARRIFARYVPFSAPFREKISANPQFSEPLRIYSSAVDAELKRLNIFKNRLEKQGIEVPEELLREIEYLNM